MHITTKSALISMALVAATPALADGERADPRGWNASAMGIHVFEDQDRNDVDYGTGLRFGLGRQLGQHWDLEWNGFGNALQRDRAGGQHWQYGLGVDALRYLYREGRPLCAAGRRRGLHRLQPGHRHQRFPQRRRRVALPRCLGRHGVAHGAALRDGFLRRWQWQRAVQRRARPGGAHLPVVRRRRSAYRDPRYRARAGGGQAGAHGAAGGAARGQLRV